MAIVLNQLAAANAASTSATTGSFTPSANAVVFAAVGGRRSSQIPVAPVVSAGGLSWATLYDQGADLGNDPRTRLALFAVLVGASPAAMTVQGTIGDVGSIIVEVFEATGISLDFSNISHGLSGTGDPAVTLPSSPGASSAVLAVTMMNSNPSISPPSGFTELYEVTGNNYQCEVAYDDTSPGASLAWASSGAVAIGIALELKPLPVIRPQPRRLSQFPGGNPYLNRGV